MNSCTLSGEMPGCNGCPHSGLHDPGPTCNPRTCSSGDGEMEMVLCLPAFDGTGARKRILEASTVSGFGHIPSSFSILEMVQAVYSVKRKQDIFVLSKGHGAFALYAVLSDLGYFSQAEFCTVGAPSSRLGVHPERSTPGIEMATGSLGHGIGVAVGMALGAQIRGTDEIVYCIVGDGELDEGTCYEALRVMVNLQLHNIRVLIDWNHSQRYEVAHDLASVCRGLGATVSVCACGNDLSEVRKHLAEDWSQVIVCRTVKGYGCRTLEQHAKEWHRRSPNEAELEQLIGELHA